jgi:hypothetical protein
LLISHVLIFGLLLDEHLNLARDKCIVGVSRFVAVV